MSDGIFNIKINDEWQPIPTIRGTSASIDFTQTTGTRPSDIPDGYTVLIYNEKDQILEGSNYQPLSFTIWNGVNGEGLVNTVDSIGVTPGSDNINLSAIRYVVQSLEDGQKSQARANIGAAPANLSINGVTLNSNGTLTLTPSNFTYDTVLDSNSSNPVQNSVLASKFTEINTSITAITPKIATITVASTSWDSGVSDVYTASVALPTEISLTSNTRADLYPNAEVMIQMVNDGIIGLYLVNDNQQLKIKAVGAKPTANLTNIQVSFVETIT